MQIRDNPELLTVMMEDAESAPAIYRPTNFWQGYVRDILFELQQLGLKDIRRRENSMLEKFGACDVDPPEARIE